MPGTAWGLKYILEFLLQILPEDLSLSEDPERPPPGLLAWSVLTLQRNLKYILLSERSQSETSTYSVIASGKGKKIKKWDTEFLGETILYDTVTVEARHYAFVETH